MRIARLLLATGLALAQAPGWCGPRRVLVVGIADARVTPASAAVATRAGELAPAGTATGTADNFCVVDTSGGAVRLSFVVGDGGKATPLSASSATGSAVGYRLHVESLSVPGVALAVSAHSRTLDLPPGAAATSIAACGAGNVRKTLLQHTLDGADIRARPLPKNGRVYTDTVTVIATPL